MSGTITVALPYCDHFAAAATSPSRADGVREKVTAHLEDASFQVHEVEPAALWADSLGFGIDGLSGELGPSLKRAWRVRATCDWLLRHRRRLTGRQLARFFGCLPPASSGSEGCWACRHLPRSGLLAGRLALWRFALRALGLVDFPERDDRYE